MSIQRPATMSLALPNLRLARLIQKLIMRLIALFLASFTVFAASEWPRFRGPNGAGLSTDRDLPAEIRKDRNVVWKAKTPKGNSSPVIVRGRMWITGHEGDERIVLCYDAQSGALLWRKSVTKAWTEVSNPINGLTTPTP